MEKTKTESLLEQARAICQRVTDREDVSDDLLRVVFMRLDEEVQEAAFDGEEDGPGIGCTVH